MTSPTRDRPRLSLHPGAEPSPGCRLIELVGEGGFGEVWKCEGPDGRILAFKAVRDRSHGLANDGPDVDREMRAVTCIRALRHPFLLSVDRAEVVEGALLLVMEWADESLSDQLHRCQAAGQTGLPRGPLLARLAEAAEVLDLLNLRCGLAHLDVKPHNLLLLGGRMKVADFGLVSRLPGGPSLAPECRPGVASPLYASPEAFRGEPSSASDQYSLALSFHELLTGALPFEARNVRQLVMQHALHEPNLDRLPDADRPVVARALSKDPERRFPSCTDFVRALAVSLLPLSPALRGPASCRFALQGPRDEELDHDQPSEDRPPTEALSEHVHRIRPNHPD